MNNSKQFIGFLSGPGGTGKSRVIDTVKHYCKLFCGELGVEFTKKTIVVAALTGSAAVSINGETMHSSCGLYRKLDKDEEWENTILVVIDEISFIKRKDFEKLNKVLNAKCDVQQHQLFGNLQIVFAGDFCQLRPPAIGVLPLFMYKDCAEWYDGVNTFLELQTNHRFHNDKKWGKLLERYRLTGPTIKDIHTINTRVVCEDNGLSEDSLPDNICYAVKTNIDRCAINDAIFSKLLSKTHSKDFRITPPDFTVCIKASGMKIKKDGTKQTYVDMKPVVKDMVHSCCCDAHVKGGRDYTQKFDPMLKLYVGCPVMITKNIDVTKCEANGAMCTFKGIEFNPGLGLQDITYVNIDGYYVRCVDASNIRYLVLELQENKKEGDQPKEIRLQVQTTAAKAHVPIPTFESAITSRTNRQHIKIKLTQFPLNIANARTVHKLQGRSLENLFLSTLDYTDNWIYVALSRVKTLKGLFLRKPLLYSKVRGMSQECIDFHTLFRKINSPKQIL
jgi:hypothetical protein